ncbi:MAG: hypothetical protein BWY56_02625 [Acidobacteria bacterium ADurb.Bin340]|nr:MAG: hypothetical protein BWY56_02625 [Acidobacteria bacterium ADurb.Bin340]
MMRRFFHSPKHSDNGALDTLPSICIFRKAGDSCIDKRIHTLTPSSTDDSRKGMRQPHSAKVCSPIRLRVPRITIRDRNRPSVAVVWIQAV